MKLLTRLKAGYYGFKKPHIVQNYLGQDGNELSFQILKPCTRFIDNSLEAQTGHILQEVCETAEALNKLDYDHALEETIDILQSCITALEIYRRYGLDVQTAIDKVFMKNNGPDRNYYCEQAGVQGNPDLVICGQCQNVICEYNWLAVARKA